MGSERYAEQLKSERERRCRVSGPEVHHLFVAGRTPLAEWLAQPGVELAEAIAEGDGCVLIRQPLRLELLDSPGALVLSLLPSACSAKMWTSPAPERLDYFQVSNQRLQNYYPHLRRMPGTYSMDTWSKEELDAVAPTEQSLFWVNAASPSASLVIAWGPDGYRRDRPVTRAFVNGLQVAEGRGILHILELDFSRVRSEHSVEGTGYWHRMVLLCGVALRRFALLRVPLEPAQAAALSRAEWQDAASLAAAVPTFAAPAPTPDEIYVNAPGARIPALACEPTVAAFPLEARKADRFRYWHFEARDALGEACLACIPDGTPIHWPVDVPADGDYHVVLHYELMMPPVGKRPRVTVQLDGQCPHESLRDCPLPFTTASGTQRPEAERFKPVSLGPPIHLAAGRHDMTLTFHENCYLILDELLLTPWELPPLPNPQSLFAGYARPPFMDVCGIEEREDATIYTLRFANAEQGPVRGSLALDESNDPGPPPVLSATAIELETPDSTAMVTLTVPVDRSSRRTRRIRSTLIGPGFCRSYYIRHRRPFEIAPRPPLFEDVNLACYPTLIPPDEAGRRAALERLRADAALAPWRDRSPEEILADPPPLMDGHGNNAIRQMVALVTLSRWAEREAGRTPGALTAKYAANLRAIMIAHARRLRRTLPANADGEKKQGVRSDYGGYRRGSIFGEIMPEDILAYDILLAVGVLSRDDQLEIESSLFWDGYEHSKRFLGGELFYRGQAHNVITATMLGLLTGDEPMLEEAELGLARFGSWQILPDGGHNEKISGYGASLITLVELAMLLARFGRPAVLQQRRETIRAACSALIRGSFSDGSLLRQGDGGIQRSFHVLSGAKLVELGLKLWPGDPEFLALKEYSDTLYKRLQAKWDHRPPAEWPPVPDRLLRKSDLFPHAGWAILRSRPGKDRMEASLDWSAMGDHGHPDKLNIVIYAFDETLSMDLAYGWPPDQHKSQGYAMRTVSHNTVVADGQCQLPGSKGTLWLFDDSDEAQIAWADAGRCYQDGIRADRCIVLLGDAVVDLFHLSGGRLHQWDWVFHCLGDIEASAAGTSFVPRGPLSPAVRPFEKVADCPGYDLLTNLREARTDATAHVSWTLDGYPQMPWAGAQKRWLAYHLGTLHLDILGGQESRYIVGDAPFMMPQSDSVRSFVIARRRSRDVLFACVFQARSDDRPPAAVEAVPVVLRGRVLEPHEATAVRLSGPDGSITVLQRHVSGTVSAGPIRAADANLVVFRQQPDGRPRSLTAFEACTLDVAGAGQWASRFPGRFQRIW